MRVSCPFHYIIFFALISVTSLQTLKKTTRYYAEKLDNHSKDVDFLYTMIFYSCEIFYIYNKIRSLGILA